MHLNRANDLVLNLRKEEEGAGGETMVQEGGRRRVVWRWMHTTARRGRKEAP